MKKALILAAAGIALAALPLYAAEEHAGQPAKGSEHPGLAAAGGEHPGAEHPGQEHAGKEVKSEHPGTEHAGKPAGQEHAGKEHPGAEHAGKPAGQEHAGKVAKAEATPTQPQAAKEFTAVDIKAAMTEHIEKLQKEGNGTFNLVDKDDNNKKLTLKFVKIHDPVRKIEGRGYFACTDFQVVGGDADQLMDLDFWLNPVGDKLTVTETKVHKDALKVAGKWTKKERYTFINDKPVAVQ